MDSLTDKDKKLVSALAADATLGFSQLGELVGLSTAAAHERVKKLKAAGIISATVALINHDQIGTSLLTFVQLKVDASDKGHQIAGLRKINEIEEIYSIAGEFSILLKVRTRDTKHMEQVFKDIYSIPGVTQSNTIIVFDNYLQRQTIPN